MSFAIPFPAAAPQAAQVHGREESAPRRMSQLHREIIRMAVLGTLDNKTIAEAVGCARETVTMVLRDGPAAQQLQELQARRDDSAVDFAQQVRALVPEAIRVYEEIVLNRDMDPKVKLHAADQILDRGGLPRQTAVSAAVTVHRPVSEEEIAEIRAAALQAAAQLGILVETPSEKGN